MMRRDIFIWFFDIDAFVFIATTSPLFRFFFFFMMFFWCDYLLIIDYCRWWWCHLLFSDDYCRFWRYSMPYLFCAIWWYARLADALWIWCHDARSALFCDDAIMMLRAMSQRYYDKDAYDDAYDVYFVARWWW